MTIHVDRAIIQVFAIALVALPTQAAAVDHEICGETMTCDCSEHPDYEECIEIDMGSLVDTSDPHAVNDAYDIETVWNDDARVWRITAKITTARTRILPVHPNRGVWESKAQLNDFLNAMLNPDNGPIGICDLYDTTPAKQYVQGYYGRWDQQNQEWASRQYQGLVFDVLSGPNGELVVNGVDIGRHVSDFNEGTWWSSVGHLSAHQKSMVTRGSKPSDHPCRTPSGEPESMTGVNTVVDNVRW